MFSTCSLYTCSQNRVTKGTVYRRRSQRITFLRLPSAVTWMQRGEIDSFGPSTIAIALRRRASRGKTSGGLGPVCEVLDSGRIDIAWPTRGFERSLFHRPSEAKPQTSASASRTVSALIAERVVGRVEHGIGCDLSHQLGATCHVASLAVNVGTGSPVAGRGVKNDSSLPRR